MRNGKLLTVVLAMIIAFSTFAGLGFAMIVPPEGPVDNARFVMDPYHRSGCVVINYCHQSGGMMYIELFNPNDQSVKFWRIYPADDDEIVQSVTPVNGVWKLKCSWLWYAFYDYATMWDSFYIADPTDPSWNQENLGSDWARHPANWDIYAKALHIIGTPTTSYAAAQAIYSHVSSKFVHDINFNTFRSDLELLNDLNIYQPPTYHGWCSSDAVILTSYARSLGIPARIVRLYFTLDPNYKGEDAPPGDATHYIAEFYVLDGGSYKWVPVDGDSTLAPGGAFGIVDVNQKIANHYQSKWYLPPYAYIVPRIDGPGYTDPGNPPSFTQIEYLPGPMPYTNTTP